MTIKVAINGFGRMGKLGFWAGWGNAPYEIIYINEINVDACCHAHLLEFDSIHGHWKQSISATDDSMRVNRQEVGFSNLATPEAVDWAAKGVDLVIDCSGNFKTEEALQPYFDRNLCA
jgi:glyceraldehyde 3-phosphate dehydrogenase